jgi:hypothetical protein
MDEAAHQSLVQAVNAVYGDKLIASLFRHEIEKTLVQYSLCNFPGH